MAIATRSLTVRRAALTDFRAIRDVVAGAWDAAYGSLIPEPERAAYLAKWSTVDRYLRELADPNSLHLVAAADAGAIGILSATLRPGFAEVWRFYVDPARSRQGVGTTLWRDLLGWCRRGGVREVRLDVFADSQSGPAFYRRHGGAILGEAVQPVSGGTTPVRVRTYGFRVR